MNESRKKITKIEHEHEIYTMNHAHEQEQQSAIPKSYEL